ncbi:acyltransferase family protein [uncultured Clostridium sp.]|uniref:acyltransferase family protein n=1 Tax=uncultured Clostridium sp. TaxID=59620 RepID=UPI003457E9C1
MYGNAIQSYIIQTFRLWTWLFYFILGWFIKEKEHTIFQISFKAHSFLLLIISIILVFFEMFIAHKMDTWFYVEYFYDALLFITWIIFLFTYILRFNIGYKSQQFISWFSKMTLGIYCIHPICMRVFTKVITVDNIFIMMMNFLLVAFASTVGILILQRFKIGKNLINI